MLGNILSNRCNKADLTFLEVSKQIVTTWGRVPETYVHFEFQITPDLRGGEPEYTNKPIKP